ncbi:MAG: hypothetical protein OEN48_11070, partial [Betaproteobacteria bacterium]|nr:hypothetical protein [Betaproteobacteria bacterium]
AELISEDLMWLEEYRRELLYGEGKSPSGSAPYDRAYAIYRLYFGPELTESMKALKELRWEYKSEIDAMLTARRNSAGATKKPLVVTIPPLADIKTLNNIALAYHNAVEDCLTAASLILEETIPEKSPIVRWCADIWARISDRFARRK